jgi:hypothetical protein
MFAGLSLFLIVVLIVSVLFPVFVVVSMTGVSNVYALRAIAPLFKYS